MPPVLHLLIIDDSKDDAWLLWHNLKRGGYDVEYEIVDSAEGMRASLANKKWDLITSDHAMPRFSAPAALALARELCPEVPFIIVSGEIDLNLAVSLMRAGADDYVQKRELALLVPAVQRVLSKTDSRREAKRMEEAFRASEVRYRRLFETAKDGILILNAASGEVVDVNPFLQEMLGYAHADIVGKKLWDIGMFLDIEASKSAFRELQVNGYIRYEDLPLQKRDGQILDVEYVSNVYLVEGEKVIQCNIRDNTARKRAESRVEILDAFLEKRSTELEAANRELEAFNYTVSHDLISPLTNINGYCQVIQELCSTKLDEQCRTYFQAIFSETQRMKELIETLLEFSSLTRSTLNVGSINLSEMVTSIAQELRSTNPRRNVTFSIADQVMATGDQKLLRIALENLLGNAWKYTKKSDKARIEFGRIDISGIPVYFIRDNGSGFDMSRADNLFTAFHRLETTKGYDGKGIGLATVKRIIERHGGQVWGEGSVGKGASFFFTLEHPLSMAIADNSQQFPQQSATSSLSHQEQK